MWVFLFVNLLIGVECVKMEKSIRHVNNYNIEYPSSSFEDRNEPLIGGKRRRRLALSDSQKKDFLDGHNKLRNEVV